ncbi:MAG: bifunctional demethylmenaquinone methyltransferase/2-methoxy-6-polyprenyl-1,4-benzoquinol methylase UbiE [Mariniphaga sp.]
MFDNISPRYDLLNHLLSANIDKLWRRKAVNRLRKFHPAHILDIATGTADFAIAASRISPEKITGVDLSEGMLKMGREKVKRKGLSSIISLQKADSEKLPFEDNKFDAAIVGFGVRNFEHPDTGLSEIYRVLRKGGVLIILEFSKPRNKLIRSIYFFYFTRVLPFWGKLLSRDDRAYTYLPESVMEFPDGENFTGLLEKAGFSACKASPQTMGIATIYEAQKH